MNSAFDYIIVGGGTAGCVLADRLSADGSNSVLLIEAGPRDWNPMYKVPIMGARLYQMRYNDWRFKTEPEPNLKNRRIPWPRGKVLGGCSSMNGMVHTRGAAADYDGWAKQGLSDWSYEKVLPYFKRIERSECGEDKFRGGSGPMLVSRAKTKHALFDAFVEAGKQSGLPFNSDFNGPELEGVGRYEMNISGGIRSSVVRSYLDSARHRPNLLVKTNTQVEKIVIENGRATGVMVRHFGASKTVQVRKEVILSSGTIGSPVTLMHSGIGPAKDLLAAGITPVHDLAEVGSNLQDHLNITLHYQSLIPDLFYQKARVERAIALFLRALLFRSGNGTIMPHSGAAFLKSDQQLSAPDLQIHFIATGMSSRRLRVFPTSNPDYGVGGHICHLTPQSRGRITVVSPDPAIPPSIQANYLQANSDRLAMRAGYRAMRRIFEQPAFKGVLGKPVNPPSPLDSDTDIDEWIAHNASTVFHPVGTCRMGTDNASVVDERLRVRGLKGLRVIDASVMPALVRANTHAPTMMIAERGADFILQECRTSTRTQANSPIVADLTFDVSK